MYGTPSRGGGSGREEEEEEEEDDDDDDEYASLSSNASNSARMGISVCISIRVVLSSVFPISCCCELVEEFVFPLGGSCGRLSVVNSCL